MSDRVSDRLGNLLRAYRRKEATGTGLERAHQAVLQAVEAYRAAWSAATRSGWTKTDLVGAGYTDPARLPRMTKAERAVRTSAPAVTSDEQGR